MKLRSLTYTSTASTPLDEDELGRIHRSCLTLNPLDGVTGILIYNGRDFLQTVEGSEDAIADLVGRLKIDERHCDFTIHEDEIVDARSFPDWTMALVQVSRGRFEAGRDVERALPPTASDTVRALLTRLAGEMAD